VQLKQALTSAVEQLESSDVGSPRLNAETLLMFVLGVNRAYLYAHPERELTNQEQVRYDEVIAQRAGDVPSQYITGHQEFWGLDFLVSPAVLIPRPETEHLVETVLKLASEVPAPRIVDVGTGSGCIALALAHEVKSAEIYGVDLAAEALAGRRDFDFVVSNPPYVGFHEADKVQRSVFKYEPKMAVFAGDNGLDVIRPLIKQAHPALKRGGYLAMEIGFSMRDPVLALLDPAVWDEPTVVADLQGIPRVITTRRR
jgi:release factor glutamine methyltransferase